MHQLQPVEATAKAKDLVRMAVARASLLKPLIERPLEINQRALIIGGGVAGLTAALNLANQGFEAIILEKNRELGAWPGGCSTPSKAWTCRPTWTASSGR